MTKLALTVCSTFVRAFLAETEVPENEAPALLRQAGVSADVLGEGRGRVTEEQFASLYRQIASRFDDELPNLLSHPLRSGAMKLAGHAVINAGTLGGAMHRHAQFFRVIVHDFETRLIGGPEVSAILIEEPASGRRCKALALVMVLRVIYGCAAWLVKRELPLVRTDFAFARPDYAEAIINMFPGPVAFGQERTRMVIATELLGLRVQRKAAELREQLARQPRDWICVPQADRVVTHQVRDFLLGKGMATANLDSVAKALHVSSRTLCRKLEAEHTSFRAAKDGARRDRAIDRLMNSAAPIAEIAYELGFGHPSAFHRAFRAWTGTTPASYRDSTAGKGGSA
jgi:AraC-like DNA-binding protein